MSATGFEQENHISAPVSHCGAPGLKSHTNGKSDLWSKLKPNYHHCNHRCQPMMLTIANVSLDINRNAKSLLTPSIKNLSSLKKNGDKSSRKAFGNVSNVLRAKTQTSTVGKTEIKSETNLKASDGSYEDKKGIKGKEQTKNGTKAETETKVDPKYLDEIENMYPIKEELLSDARDPLTKDLFAIDDQSIRDMAFDEDFCEELLPKKAFDFDKFF